MKKRVLASAIAVVSLTGVSGAQAAEVSANAALSSDYMFRGVTQTSSGPAFSGGFDVDFGNGFYIGNWNSNVNFVTDGAQLEMDFYGGYAGDMNGISYDLGVLHYFYEGEGAAANPALDTTEIYANLGYMGFSLGASYAVSDDYFGVTGINSTADQAGSYYVNLGYEYAFSDQLSIAASYGFTEYDTEVASTNSTGNYGSYSDYSMGLTYSMDRFDFGVAVIGADDDGEALFGKDGTEARLVVSVGTSF